MNADRRKRLETIAQQLQDLSAELCSVKDEEQEAFDNLAESFQQGEQGQKMETAISAMDEAESEINDAADHATEAAE